MKGIVPTGNIKTDLQAIGMDWEVQIADLQYFACGSLHKPRGARVAYRSDDGTFIDYYRDRKPLQNREVLEAMYKFAEMGNLPLEAIGSTDKNRAIWAEVKLPETLQPLVAKGDVTDISLVLYSSHTNGTGVSVHTYGTRLVCTNGMTVRSSVRQAVMPHTKSLTVAHVQGALITARANVTAQQEIVDLLSQTRVEPIEAHMHLIKAFGEVGKPIEEQPRIVQVCMRLFQGQGLGSGEPSAYNTAYGLLNAVTEYYNHHTTASDVVKQMLVGNRARQMHRFQRQLVGVSGF